MTAALRTQLRTRKADNTLVMRAELSGNTQGVFAEVVELATKEWKKRQTEKVAQHNNATTATHP